MSSKGKQKPLNCESSKCLLACIKSCLKENMLRDSECKIDNPRLEQIFANEFFNERQQINNQCGKVFFKVHNSTIILRN